MSVPDPLVSVFLPTYNHEKYIGEALGSALGQTYPNLQVVVVDDGSTDRTPEVIRAIRDPRLVYIRQENQGPSAAANAALAACRGQYVANMSGDDVLHPDRVRRQLAEYLRGGRRMLFTDVDYIDDDGRPVPGGARRQRLRCGLSHPEMVEHLFSVGCCFAGVTAFTERQLLVEAGPQDPRLINQDLDMWLRLIKRYPFQVMPERLYKFRIRDGHGNLSTPGPGRVIRYGNEVHLMLRHFFDDMPVELFRAAFRGQLTNPDFAGPTEYACEQAFLYLKSRLAAVPLLGVEKLYQLLGDADSAAVLRDRYGMTPLRFSELLQSVNVTGAFAGQTSLLFVDPGGGWDPANVLTAPVDPGREFFELTFDLTRFATVKELAWSPLEGWLCQVRIDGCSLRDRSGAVREVGLSELRANAEARPDGTLVFATGEPRVYVPVGGPAARVTIRGSLHAEPPQQSISRLAASVTALQASLDGMRSSRSWRLTAPLRLFGRWARKAAGRRESA